jgi:tetratricopeptide (TPR) repeat protein
MSATASEEDEEARAAEVCASCGIAALDNIILEDCDGCDLVKYCGDKCRGEHRHWHAGDCKRRAKELHDRKLFTQPDSCCYGECPICFLPLPLVMSKSTLKACCSKTICNGCNYAHRISNKNDLTLTHCPFCREPVPADDEEHEKRIMKRAKANDPVALCELGLIRYYDGDYDGAVEFLAKAAELGDLVARYQLGWMYERGEGVEKDKEKEVYHYERAAIGGQLDARYNLGNHEEWNGGRVDRAVKHWIISANLGHTESMEALWDHYKNGNMSKEDLEATLRAHQAAIDAMKSPEREAAQAFYDATRRE